jgi:hypothetical protein
VIAAGPPGAIAARSFLALRNERLTRFHLRRPQPAAIEPAQHRVRILALQLVQRRQELFGIGGPERRRYLAVHDHPERMSTRHVSAAPGASAFR